MPRRVLLQGRRQECETLDHVIEAVRAGHSRALVVRGEAGIGKTALLEYVVESASGVRVERTAGVHSEMELAFAGLQQLCAPMLDRLERLPGPQRDALSVAFGLSDGDAPDRFLVGLATLSLLSAAAEQHPLVCVVDDAHWLDGASAQALAFVARRLADESVAVVFATREPSEEFTGLPELVVEGLGEADARALLGSVLRGPLDERVRDRIVAETRGNPLGLLELPRGLTPAELAGGFGLPDALPLSGWIEESFRRRLAALPAASQRLLLVAAAEPVGEPVLVWRAAERLGIGPEAAAPAAAAGLCEFGARVRFRHPLVRSAVYRSAPLEDAQSVHRALAEVTDPGVDPDRRAWHRAKAAPGPDEDVATELERSAGRAQARGGLAAAAAFLERATALTLEPARRAGRALAAAHAKHGAGAPDAALELLATAEVGPLDELQRARVDVLRARLALGSGCAGDAPRLLIAAAKRLEPLDVTLAREAYMYAMSATIFASRQGPGGAVAEMAEAVRAAPRPLQPPRVADLLLDGHALLATEGYSAAVPVLKRALSAARDENVSGEEGLRWHWLACRVAMALWDDEAWYDLSARNVRLARDAGALTALPVALSAHAGIHVYAGRLDAARALTEEARELSPAVGSPNGAYGGLVLAAWRGREAETTELLEACTRDAAARGEGRLRLVCEFASAVLYNGLGRYDLAIAAAEAWTSDDLGFISWRGPELVEAAVRQGRPELAATALRRVRESTLPSGTDWALGIEARSRALVSEGQAAEDLYREAIDRLGRTRIRVELARAHLLYGEWLRRERRRLEAREQLRTAHKMFTAMGVEAFAGRAARELQATGATARKRTTNTRDQLTAREAEIAALARDGLSNPAIGTRLFIAPGTVQYHLHKVFAKLGIGSRNELQNVLPGGSRAGQAAAA